MRASAQIGLLIVGLALGGASSSKTGEAPPLHPRSEPASHERSPPKRPPAPRYGRCPAPAGIIKRADLNRILELKPARFLRGLWVIRHPTRAGPFHGWRIKRFHPGEPCLARTGIREGDIILSVNGSRLEKPEALYQVWSALKAAPRITVRLLRGGQLYFFAVRIKD